MDALDPLRARLRTINPASVCALDDTAAQLLADTLPAIPCVRPDTVKQPCALALGLTVLDTLSADDARQFISRVRLYVAPRLLLRVRADCALDDAAFRALAFVREADADDHRLYAYDLDTYKAVPDWLNDRYWAHPERWQP
jgi:hypothetical protein